MVHQVEFFREIPAASIALEGLQLLVHVALMLDQVGLLHEGVLTFIAFETAFIRV